MLYGKFLPGAPCIASGTSMNLSCELIAGEINVFQKAHFFISMELQKKSKNILSIFKISKERDNNTFCPFSQFLRKGTKRDIKVFKIHQNFWFFMSLFVPFPTNFVIKIGILSVFMNILSLFVPFCPFLSCPFWLVMVAGGQKGT